MLPSIIAISNIVIDNHTTISSNAGYARRLIAIRRVMAIELNAAGIIRAKAWINTAIGQYLGNSKLTVIFIATIIPNPVSVMLY